MTAVVIDLARPQAPPEPVRVHVPRAAYRLSIALVVVTLAGAGLSFLMPGVLGGPDVMDGSVRGTGLVLTVVTVPMLIVAMMLTTRGSTAGFLMWVGGVAHVLYQSVLFLFATPFNELFLLYCAMGMLGIWTAVALLAGLDTDGIATLITPGMPRRAIATYVWAIAGLNAVAWLARIVPELTADRAGFLVGTGMTTNPVFVNDLVVWLPMMAIGAWWLSRGRPWGYVVIGAMLVMWQVESITVAADQWMGATADPDSTVASMGGAYLFVAMAIVNIPPLVAFYRHVPRTRN